MAPSTFLYRGQAAAIGGSLRRPVSKPINGAAASVLTHAGGFHSSRVQNYDLDNIVKFTLATTEVSGSQAPDGAYTSYASAVVENLNIYNQVTADRIVGHLSSRLAGDGAEMEILSFGTLFTNLRIGGVPVEPQLAHGLFGRLKTQSALLEAWKNTAHADHAALRAAARKWYCTPEEEKADETARAPIRAQKLTRDGMVRASLFSGFTSEPGHLTRSGFEVTLPNFGTIILAELFIGKDTRRLNMLRLKMGSPVEGDMDVAGLDLNGSLYP
ncbi:MAG: hypothetical protein LC126_26500 [Bryobacterales bacterium]|nr:hypothetical protein [Bryobacterales bacterium]